MNAQDYINYCNDYFKDFVDFNDSDKPLHNRLFFLYSSRYADNKINYQVSINSIILKKKYLDFYDSSPQNSLLFWEHIKEVISTDLEPPYNFGLRDKKTKFAIYGNTNFLKDYYISYNYKNDTFKILKY